MLTLRDNYRIIQKIAHNYSRSNYSLDKDHEGYYESVINLKSIIYQHHGLEVEVIESTRKIGEVVDTRKLSITVIINST